LVFRSGNAASLDDNIEPSGEAFIVHEGNGVHKYYLNGKLKKTVNITTHNSELATIYLGQNLSSTQSLNGFIKTLKFWDFAMTDSEVKYASGEYQLNRFIDRG